MGRTFSDIGTYDKACIWLISPHAALGNMRTNGSGIESAVLS